MGGFDAYRWRREFMASELGKNARSVAHALEARMKDGTCFPGLRRIERDTGLSRHTVVAAVYELEQSAWVIVDRRPHRSNVYRAAFPGGAVAAPPAADAKPHVVHPTHPRGAVVAHELRNELQKGSRTEERLKEQPSRDTSRSRSDSKRYERKNSAAPTSFSAEEEAEMDRLWELSGP